MIKYYLLFPILFLLPGILSSEDIGWRRDGSGIFPGCKPPLEWDLNEGTAWHTLIKGGTHSTPIVCNNRIFTLADPGTLYCLDAETGAILWKNEITHPGADPDRIKRISRLKYGSGKTASSPVTDGTYVYAVSADSFVICCDYDGKLIWSAFPDIGPYSPDGRSASPVLTKDFLVLSLEGLLALDRKTGNRKWYAEEAGESWGTPVLFKYAKAELLISPSGTITSAKNGKVLKKRLGEIKYASPVVNGNCIYFIGKNSSAWTFSVEKGKLKVRQRWETKLDGEYFSSPVVHKGTIYCLNSLAELYLINEFSCKKQKKVSLQMPPNGLAEGSASRIYSSLCLVGHHLYAYSSSGDALVFKPDGPFTGITRNFCEESKGSSLFFMKDSLYIRTKSGLACIRKTTEKEKSAKIAETKTSLFIKSPIPDDRIINWNPGVRKGIPAIKSPLTPIQLKESDTNTAALIQKAIDSLKTPGVVLLPAGTFNLNKQLVLKSGVIIRGMGADNTRLLFNIPQNSFSGAIKIRGYRRNESNVTQTIKAGSSIISVEDTSDLKIGSSIILSMENNPEVMYTKAEWNADWASRSVGQILRVTKITGNTLSVDVPVRLEYPINLQPRIQTLHPITDAGVENLYIKRIDQAEDSNIYIVEAENCWVRNIESDFCMRGHVWISRSRFITVEGSYFHHAYNYGGGGHGYGAVAGTQVTDSLITNNIFQHLRHSMMTKEGANGNVFSYNYSFELANKLCDISVHGHYSYMNLFEGNVVEFIQFADYWGPAGPLTTAFRNRINILMRVNDSSHKANIIGNTFLTGGWNIQESCKDTFVLGNINKLKKDDSGKALSPLPPSLYLKEKPDFWGSLPWPSIGADMDQGNKLQELPAQIRYKEVICK